jgi:hypothetical protein
MLEAGGHVVNDSPDELVDLARDAARYVGPDERD